MKITFIYYAQFLEINCLRVNIIILQFLEGIEFNNVLFILSSEISMTVLHYHSAQIISSIVHVN